MFLFEYQARDCFDKVGLDVMNSVVVDSISSLESDVHGLEYPLVVKAQVQTGGRGKAGGIKFASDHIELKKYAEEILGMQIKEHTVSRLMITEKADIVREFYLSIILDRQKKKPVVIFSQEGGMDIEAVAAESPESVIRQEIDPLIGYKLFHTHYLAGKSGVGSECVPRLHEVIKKAYKLFMETDALLVEINPLALCTDGKYKAIDGKMNVDDSSLFRQQAIAACRDELTEHPLVLEARKYRFLYIPVDAQGEISIISNGSGMLMSTMDLISNIDMKILSVLDLGGGATADRIKEAVRILFFNSEMKYLFINIFGGITRCDEVANGIKAAISELPDKRKIFVRLEGTNKVQGLSILNEAGSHVISVDGLVEGVRTLSEHREVV